MVKIVGPLLAAPVGDLFPQWATKSIRELVYKHKAAGNNPVWRNVENNRVVVTFGKKGDPDSMACYILERAEDSACDECGDYHDKNGDCQNPSCAYFVPEKVVARAAK